MKYTNIILRGVIPVVLSNKKNKLVVHMYIVKNTTIFLIVPLLLLYYTLLLLRYNVGHLQVVHEEPYDKLYLHVSGGTVCGVGWVRDLVLCL